MAGRWEGGATMHCHVHSQVQTSTGCAAGGSVLHAPCCCCCCLYCFWSGETYIPVQSVSYEPHTWTGGRAILQHSSLATRNAPNAGVTVGGCSCGTSDCGSRQCSEIASSANRLICTVGGGAARQGGMGQRSVGTVASGACCVEKTLVVRWMQHEQSVLRGS